MSTTVDRKVVQMEFDNKQANKNLDSTIRYMDQLQDSITSCSASAGGLSSLGSAITQVEAKFSTMQYVVANVLTDIVRRAMSSGEQLVKSLSIDQVTAGFSKYEEKTTAVQTIMNAVRKEGESEADAMARVNEQLEKLNLFTDETSYNFTDMTNNIGKFTAQGVDLETSVKAMEGISTWASISGQGVQQASMAMYNLAQALSAGAVKTKDWMSIENANMATEEFKNTVIQTAIELGELNENTTITSKTFRESLSEGWFTTDVLLATLEKYGGFADKLLKYVDETDITATKLQEYLVEYQTRTGQDRIDYLKEISEETGVNATKLYHVLEDLNQVDEKTGKRIYELGQKAFRAAQEAKTFTEAINSVKDAVSTGFLNVFETIFGDYLRAKEFWTDLANDLYDIFVEPINSLQEFLNSWAGLKDGLGNRSDLVAGLKNTMEGIKTLLKVIGEAWKDIFPPMAVETLGELVLKFKEWSESFKERDWGTFKTILSGIFSTFKIILNTIKAIIAGLEPLKPIFKSVFDFIVTGMTKLAEKFIDISGDASIFEKITEVVSKASTAIAKFLSPLTRLNEVWEFKLPDEKNTIFGWIISKIKETKAALTEFIGSFIPGLFDKGNDKIDGNPLEKKVLSLDRIVEFISDIFSKTFDYIAPMIDTIIDGTKKLLLAFSEVIKKLDFKALFSFAAGVAASIDLISGAISRALIRFNVVRMSSYAAEAVENFADILYEVERGIKRISKSVSQYFKTKALQNVGRAFMLLGIGIAAVVGSLWLLTKIDPEKLRNALGILILIAGGMAAFLLVASKIPKKQMRQMSSMGYVFETMAKSFLKMSVAILIISKAVESDEKFKNVRAALLLLIGVIAAMAGITYAISKIKNMGMGIYAMEKFASIMLKMSIALAALGGAIRILRLVAGSKNAAVESLRAIGIVTLLLAGMALISAAFSKIQRPNKASGAIFLLSISLASLAGAIAVFKLINWNDGLKALAALTSFGLMSAVLAKIFSKISFTGILKFTTGFAIFSAAMIPIIVSMKALGKLKWGEIAKGLVAMAGAIAIFGAASAILAKISPAMLLVSIAFGILSASMLGIAASFLLISNAMTKMGKISAKESAQMTIAMGAFGAGLILILNDILEWIVISGPRIIEAIVNVFAGILMALPGLVMATVSETFHILAQNAPQIVEDLCTFIEGTLRGINNHLAGIVDELIILIGTILDKSIEAIPRILPKVLEFTFGLINSLTSYVIEHQSQLKEVLTNLIQAILAIVRVVVEASADSLYDLGGFIWGEASKGLEDGMTSGNRSIMGILAGAVTSLFTGNNALARKMEVAGDAIAKWIQSGFTKNIGDLYTDILRERYPELYAEEFLPDLTQLKKATFEQEMEVRNMLNGVDLTDEAAVKQALDNYKDTISQFRSVDFNMASREDILNFRKEQEVFSKTYDELQSSLRKIGRGMSVGSKSQIEDAIKTSNWITQQVMEGLMPTQEGIDKLKLEWTKVGYYVPKAYEDALQIHSPSKVMQRLAWYTIDGLVVGINQNADTLATSMYNLGEQSTNAFEAAFEEANNILQNEDQLQPVISPVLDLDEIRSGAKDIGGILGGSSGIAFGTSVSMRTATEARDYLKELIDALKTKEETPTVNNTFNITGDDPEEIANAVADIIQRDIYGREKVWA